MWEKVEINGMRTRSDAEPTKLLFTLERQISAKEPKRFGVLAPLNS